MVMSINGWSEKAWSPKIVKASDNFFFPTTANMKEIRVQDKQERQWISKRAMKQVWGTVGSNEERVVWEAFPILIVGIWWSVRGGMWAGGWISGIERHQREVMMCQTPKCLPLDPVIWEDVQLTDCGGGEREIRTQREQGVGVDLWHCHDHDQCRERETYQLCSGEREPFCVQVCGLNRKKEKKKKEIQDLSSFWMISKNTKIWLFLG
jgi:hypothetical protein